MRKIFLSIGVFLTLIMSVQAGGYRVSLQGVRQAAMAHTSAHTKDASVMFFNPAGISFVESKLSVAFGVFGISAENEYQNAATNYSAKTDSPLGTPAYLAVSYRPLTDFTVGLSVTTPYGSTIKWDDTWAGNQLVQEIDLKAFYIQPTVAYKFSEWFSAGFGFIYARGSVNLKKQISVGGQLELDATEASGTGFNLGAYFKPSNKLDISVGYRSNVDMKVTGGDANFKGVPSSLIGGTTFVTANDKFDATLPLVSELLLGVSYKVTPKLTLAADVNFAGWQKYKNLTFDFEQNNVGNQTDLTISKSAKNFKQSNIYRIGGEYKATDKLDLRLGYYYDQSPVKDAYWSPETPSTNNHAFTGGLGYKFGKGFNVDLFGAYLKGEVRDVNNTIAGFTGQARSKAVYFGLGFSYNAF